jgi:hypothetical protein
LPTQRLASAVSLDHPKISTLDFLVGRESVGATDTFPPSPDAFAILGQAGVDDFIFDTSAFGAKHLVVGTLTSRTLTQQVVVSS